MHVIVPWARCISNAVWHYVVLTLTIHRATRHVFVASRKLKFCFRFWSSAYFIEDLCNGNYQEALLNIVYEDKVDVT